MEHLKKYWYWYVIGLLVLLFIFRLSRKKKLSKNKTNVPGSGMFFFRNTQEDPYNIYLDGNQVGILQPNSTSEGFKVSLNKTHEAKAEQISGYWFNPTIETNSFTVSSAYNTYWEF